MSDTNIENQDSQNLENGENLENENQDSSQGASEETVESLKQRNQSLYEQLKKAKGFTRDEEGKWIKKQEPTVIHEKPKANSNEFGYAEKAFLTASGLKGSKEFGLAQQFAKETGKTLEQVLESKYFQQELNDLREIERTANATITGKDSKGVSIDSVEYWASKEFKDVPREMKAKVIDYQLKKEKEKDVFYNSNR